MPALSSHPVRGTRLHEEDVTVPSNGMHLGGVVEGWAADKESAINDFRRPAAVPFKLLSRPICFPRLRSGLSQREVEAGWWQTETRTPAGA